MAYNLKHKIIEHLDRKNISVSEFERQAGLKPSAIRNILYGKSKSPSIDTVQNIASELGVTVDMLLSDNTVNLEERKALIKPVDMAILKKTTKDLLDAVDNQGINLYFDDCIDLIKSAYSYGLKKGRVDKDFIEWIVSRRDNL